MLRIISSTSAAGNSRRRGPVSLRTSAGRWSIIGASRGALKFRARGRANGRDIRSVALQPDRARGTGGAIRRLARSASPQTGAEASRRVPPSTRSPRTSSSICAGREMRVSRRRWPGLLTEARGRHVGASHGTTRHGRRSRTLRTTQEVRRDARHSRETASTDVGGRANADIGRLSLASRSNSGARASTIARRSFVWPPKDAVRAAFDGPRRQSCFSTCRLIPAPSRNSLPP